MPLTAVDNGGSIAFACTSTGSTDITAYLPSSCADVTGDPVVAGPTPWAERDRSDPDLTACCDGPHETYGFDADGVPVVLPDGMWVVGVNSWTLTSQDLPRGLADSGHVVGDYKGSNIMLYCISD